MQTFEASHTMYAYTFILIFAYTPASINTYIHTYANIRSAIIAVAIMYAQVHMRKYIIEFGELHSLIHARVHAYIHTCIHAYTHTYTNACILSGCDESGREFAGTSSLLAHIRMWPGMCSHMRAYELKFA